MRGLGSQRLRQPLLHLGAGDRVERGERLVERQHRLAGDEGAEEGDALAHSAGELGRRGLLEAGEAEALEERPRLSPSLCPAQAAVAQRQGRVVDRRVPGQQQVALGHVGATGEALGRAAGATDLQGSGARLAQPADQLQQGRLAAAGWPDQADHAARAHLEIEPVDRPQLAVGVLEGANRDARARRTPARRRRHLSDRNLAVFRSHPGILAHSALLTKEVRKVDKHPLRGQQNSPWTRQSSSSDWASACSSA